MPETSVVTPEVKAEPQVSTPEVKEVTKETPKPDLMARVSQFKPEVKPEVKKEEGNEFGLTAEDYAKVNADPVLSKFYKSMQSGFGKKSQEIAELRKTYEAEKQRLTESANWTPERVQSLLNDPNFVASAQKVAQSQAPKGSGLSDSDWSALSDSDKAKFSQLESKVNSYEQLLLKERQQKEDTELKQKYPDYAPDIIDLTVSNLISGKVQATREDLYKVINYDKHMKEVAEKAYGLGKQDAAEEFGIKRQASSMDGFTTTTPRQVVEPTKGESDSSFFKRSMIARLLQKK